MIDDILRIAKREWDWLLREKRYLVLVIVGPILFALVLDLIYSPKKVMNLPVVFVDQDHSVLSREMIRAILANETFKSAGFINSTDEFPRLVAEDRAHVCFVFPYGLERDLKHGKGGRIEVLVDQSNYLAGKIELSNTAAVLAPYSVAADARMIESMHGVKESVALREAAPVGVGQRVLFNPAFTSNYLNFVPFGAACIALQITAFLCTIRSGASEYGGRAFQPLSSYQCNVFTLAAGKVLACVAPVPFLFLFVFGMKHLIFGAPFVRTGISFWVVIICWPAALASVGYGLSALSGDAIVASEAATAVTLPNYLASGFTWPLVAFPKAVLILAYVLPMMSMSFMLKKIIVMGGTLADCGNQIWTLIGWSVVGLAMAWAGTIRILRQNPQGSEVNG
jgi:ABC-2 type transport system permease protein